MEELSNETMAYVKKGGIEYVQFRRLLAYENVLTHCYTLKGDAKDYKERKGSNYADLCDCLGVEDKRLVKIDYQAHSDLVEVVTKPEDTFTNVDGLMTDQRQIPLSLRYADCIPLYFFDPVKQVIANIHSGWQGTVSKIGIKAVSQMEKEYRCKPENIICCIGPSILKCHFEVEEEVKKRFETTFYELCQTSPIIQTGEVKEGKQKYHIDTVLINRLLLEKIGLKKENIVESNLCTVCHEDRMHSYRKNGKEAGRNTAILALR